MKTLNLLFLFICCVSFSTSYAQFGVKLGANIGASGSYGNSEEGESASLRPGFQAGVFYMHPLNDKLSILAELNYEAKGTVSKKDYTIEQFPVQDPSTGAILGVGTYDINQEIKSTQNYLNIPILFAFKMEKIKLYAGPNFGFLLSGKAKFNRTTNITLGSNPLPPIVTDHDDIDWKDYESFKRIFAVAPSEDGNFLNSFEFGINLGAMYAINDKLHIDLRVSQGINDVTNNHYDDSIYPSEDFSFASRDDTDRNLSIQLSLAYTLGSVSVE